MGFETLLALRTVDGFYNLSWELEALLHESDWVLRLDGDGHTVVDRLVRQ